MRSADMPRTWYVREEQKSRSGVRSCQGGKRAAGGSGLAEPGALRGFCQTLSLT